MNKMCKIKTKKFIKRVSRTLFKTDRKSMNIYNLHE